MISIRWQKEAFLVFRVYMSVIPGIYTINIAVSFAIISCPYTGFHEGLLIYCADYRSRLGNSSPAYPNREGICQEHSEDVSRCSRNQVLSALPIHVHNLHGCGNDVRWAWWPLRTYIGGVSFVGRNNIQDHRDRSVQSLERLIAVQGYWFDVDNAASGLPVYTEDVLMKEE